MFAPIRGLYDSSSMVIAVLNVRRGDYEASTTSNSSGIRDGSTCILKHLFLQRSTRPEMFCSKRNCLLRRVRHGTRFQTCCVLTFCSMIYTRYHGARTPLELRAAAAAACSKYVLAHHQKCYEYELLLQ